MRTLLIITISVLMINCSSSKNFKEVNEPFKNYTEHYSPFLPINQNKTLYKFWFFESTSVDRLLLINLDDKNEYKSELIEFGEKYYKNKIKEVYKTTTLNPRNGYDNLYNFLQKNLNKDTFQEFKMNDVAFDEPILNYVIEWKTQEKNYQRKLIAIPKSELESQNTNIEVIKFIKSEFNLK